MPTFHTSRHVAHSATNMFALVADVKQYPKFVPLCQSLQISRREKTGEKEVVIASMTVAYKFFTESFTSRVLLKPAEHAIDVSYLDGPFRRLENHWTFTPLGENESQIGFFLDYEFRSMAMQMLMGAVFDRAFRKFADAFEARANVVYRNGAVAMPETGPAVARG
ncbi:MAG: type II toxin-antitoxin system RatA family toxin [Rhodomicrobium sp.]